MSLAAMSAADAGKPMASMSPDDLGGRRTRLGPRTPLMQARRYVVAVGRRRNGGVVVVRSSGVARYR